MELPQAFVETERVFVEFVDVISGSPTVVGWVGRES